MIDLYKEIDWSEELNQTPELAEYIKKAADEMSKTIPRD